MNDKVIVLANKEQAPNVIQRIEDAGMQIKSRLGTFIILKDSNPDQEAELASHGIEVQNLQDAVDITSQLSEEDDLLIKAFFLRKTDDYKSKEERPPSEEEDMMSEIDCGGDH